MSTVSCFLELRACCCCAHAKASRSVAPTSLGLAGLAVPEWIEGTDYSHIRAPRRTYNADGSVDMTATRARMEAARAAEPDSALLQLVVPTRHADSVDRAWRGVVFRDGWKYAATPAHRTAAGGLSAGAAVLVRKHRGVQAVRSPCGGMTFEVCPGRAAACIVDGGLK